MGRQSIRDLDLSNRGDSFTEKTAVCLVVDPFALWFIVQADAAENVYVPAGRRCEARRSQ